MKKLLVVSLLALVLPAYAAQASVVFEPSTGVGFVDSVDIQKAFGLTSGQFKKVASNVGFVSHESDFYTAVCSNGQTYYPSFDYNFFVNSSVAYNHNQPSGYALNGFIDPIIVSNAPRVGGTCPGGTWTYVVKTVSYSLTAQLGDASVAIR